MNEIDIFAVNTNYAINGFSIKDTIQQVISQYNEDVDSDCLSEEITDALAAKLRLKQGDL